MDNIETKTTHPDETLEIAKNGMRLIRDTALSKTDWMVVTDTPLPESKLALVKMYRQYLRDLPETMTDDDFLTFKGVLSLNDFTA